MDWSDGAEWPGEDSESETGDVSSRPGPFFLDRSDRIHNRSLGRLFDLIYKTKFRRNQASESPARPGAYSRRPAECRSRRALYAARVCSRRAGPLM